MQLCAKHTNSTCHYSEVCKVVSIDDRGDVLGCSSNGSIFTCVTNMWQKVVCTKPEFLEWHALQCVKRKCKDYGLKLLNLCPMEIDLDHSPMLHWKCF